jgi:hypothetical protein
VTVERPRRWPYVALAGVGVLGGLFCLAGFAMAADFTVADSPHLQHWQRVAKVYLGLAGLSFVLLSVGLAGLWCQRRRVGESLSRAI